MRSWPPPRAMVRFTCRRVRLASRTACRTLWAILRPPDESVFGQKRVELLSCCGDYCRRPLDLLGRAGVGHLPDRQTERHHPLPEFAVTLAWTGEVPRQSACLLDPARRLVPAGV